MLVFEKTYIGHQGPIYSICPTTDGWLSAGGDGLIIEWQIGADDGRLIAKASSPVYCLCKMDHVVVAGTLDGQVLWLDVVNYRLIKHFQLSKYAVYCMLKIGDKLYMGAADGYLTLWDIATMAPIRSIKVSQYALRSLQWHLGTLYVGSSDGTIYSINNYEEVSVVTHHGHTIFCMTSKSQELWYGTKNAKIGVLKNNQTTILDAHWYAAYALLSVDNAIISASRDKTIRVWDAKDHTLIQSVSSKQNGHFGSINTLCQLQKYVISGSDDRTIKTWLIES